MSDRIEEIFVPAAIDTVDGLMNFLVIEILKRGGNPSKISLANTESAITNVAFSDEWPCWTIQFEYC